MRQTKLQEARAEAAQAGTNKEQTHLDFETYLVTYYKVLTRIFKPDTPSIVMFTAACYASGYTQRAYPNHHRASGPDVDEAIGQLLALKKAHPDNAGEMMESDLWSSVCQNEGLLHAPRPWRAHVNWDLYDDDL